MQSRPAKVVYRRSLRSPLEPPISTSSSAPSTPRGNKLIISKLDRPATSDEAEPTYAVRVVSDTLSRALDEPEQHLQTIEFASPLGSFWLRSALGTYRPTAARAVRNGALSEQQQPPIPWPDRSDVEEGGRFNEFTACASSGPLLCVPPDFGVF